MTFDLISSGFAYIDGGSASMLFQALIGGLLAASCFATSRLSALWQRMRQLRRPVAKD